MKTSLHFLIVSMLACSTLILYSCKDDKEEEEDDPTEICDDGIDNDGDGFVDCDDFDCDSGPACQVEICNDGVDNDGDGFTDCEDVDCEEHPDCL